MTMEATKTRRVISIFRDGVWAGSGTIDENNEIHDCGAVLGKDQDESDQTYENITAAIEDDDEDVILSYGRFTWEIGDNANGWTPTGI